MGALREEFEAVTADIELYLGWLKGNETAWEWREEYKAAYFDYDPPYVEIPPTFSTSPSQREFTVFYQTLMLPESSVGTGTERFEFGRQINERMQQSWDNGVLWAKGIGGYLNDLCADVIRPDAGQLESSVQAFRDSMTEVEAALPVQWTDLDFNSWTGLSSDDCQSAVDNLHSIVRDQYLTYYAHSFTLYGGACAIAVNAQKGLLEMMKDVREGLKANLTAWSNLGAPPFDIGPISVRDAKLVEIATSIVGKIPVFGDIQSAVTDFASIGNNILSLFDLDVSWADFELDAKDADTTFTDLTAKLQDKVLTPLATSMDKLHAEKSQKIALEQNGVNPWYPPALAGVANEPWEHEAED